MTRGCGGDGFAQLAHPKREAWRRKQDSEGGRRAELFTDPGDL